MAKDIDTISQYAVKFTVAGEEVTVDFYNYASAENFKKLNADKNPQIIARW